MKLQTKFSKKAHADSKQIGKSVIKFHKPPNDNSITTQRARVLEWLHQKPLTRFQAEKELNVVSLAARIFELRNLDGYNIVSHWQYDLASGNSLHRVCQYILMSGKWAGGRK